MFIALKLAFLRTHNTFDNILIENGVFESQLQEANFPLLLFDVLLLLKDSIAGKRLSITTNVSQRSKDFFVLDSRRV